MKQVMKTSIILLGVLLSGCGEERQSSVLETSTQQPLRQVTSLHSTIQGTLDGNAFVQKVQKSEIITTGENSSLELSWAIGQNIIVLDISGYHGKDDYGKNLNVIWQHLAMAGTLLEVEKKVFKVTKDTAQNIAGKLEIIVKSKEGTQNHLVGKFNMKKIHFDETNEVALLEKIREDARIIASLNPKWRTDKSYVIKAFRSNKAVISMIDTKFMQDKEFLLQLIEINPKAAVSIYYMLDENIRQDKVFTLKVLSLNKKISYLLPASLQNDSDIQKMAKKSQ